MGLTAAQSTYVREVLALCPLLSFNEPARTFDITVEEPTWAQIESLAPAIKKLRNTPPEPPFSGVTVDRLALGYRDQCLQRYLVQRLGEGRPHAETCWVRFAENTHCLGRRSGRDEFDDEARKRVMTALAQRRDSHIFASIARACRRDPSLIKAVQRDEDGWILFMADIPIISLMWKWRVRFAVERLVKRLRRIPDEDRVVGIVNSMKAQGWNNQLARTPSSSVLGFSHTTGRYNAMTGRHRMAAARYLYEQGLLDGSTHIEVPIVTYRWPMPPHTRPHPDTPLCKECR